MARRIDGYVLRLRCARCERRFPHVIFSGDTDMATDGLCSLTAVGQDEVVVGEFDASERRLDYNGAENAFAERISQLLDRNDLRAIRLLRSEPSSSPDGKYTAPRTIYSCPICSSGEAQEIEKMDWERFRAVGGQITIIGDMELLAGQMAEPGWTEVKRLEADDPHRYAVILRGPHGLYRFDAFRWRKYYEPSEADEGPIEGGWWECDHHLAYMRPPKPPKRKLAQRCHGSVRQSRPTNSIGQAPPSPWTCIRI